MVIAKVIAAPVYLPSSNISYQIITLHAAMLKSYHRPLENAIEDFEVTVIAFKYKNDSEASVTYEHEELPFQVIL